MELDFKDHPDFAFKDPSDVNGMSEEKKRYKSIQIGDDTGLSDIRKQLDKDQLIVFETCVNYAKSIKKSEGNDTNSVRPPLIIVQGGAGSGKSFVIDAISQHMEKILRSSGDNPDHPYIIKAAFTGTAAANIKGQTLHNAFSFGFGNEFFSLSDIARDERRTDLENLKIVIIDEFSMIKSDMMY